MIYPQNKEGVPVFNEYGEYYVRLYYNGLFRKIKIDDVFPVDEKDELLCTYSLNKNEIWISLIEKAFLKMFHNNGYNFDGSNSCNDIYLL
jgi:calpain-7